MMGSLCGASERCDNWAFVLATLLAILYLADNSDSDWNDRVTFAALATLFPFDTFTASFTCGPTIETAPESVAGCWFGTAAQQIPASDDGLAHALFCCCIRISIKCRWIRAAFAFRMLSILLRSWSRNACPFSEPSAIGIRCVATNEFNVTGNEPFSFDSVLASNLLPVDQ